MTNKTGIWYGPEPKYDRDYHGELLLTLFSAGHDVAMFCSSCTIARSTFYEWIKKYKEFAKCYEIAKEKSRAWWETQALIGITDTSFNTTLWSINMRNRFGYTEHRLIQIDKLNAAKTPAEQMGLLFYALSIGKITGPEAMQISNAIIASIKVNEYTVMQNNVTALLESKDKQ